MTVGAQWTSPLPTTRQIKLGVLVVISLLDRCKYVVSH